MNVRSILWQHDEAALDLLDQRLLPAQEQWMRLTRYEAVVEAIKTMAVRGAPAIGISAAYGMALAARSGADRNTAHAALAGSRPTAVNLVWALERLQKLPWEYEAILAEAQAIEREDLEMNLAIGRNGAALITPGARILTICNTGAIATAGHGTALGIIRSAFAKDPSISVFACETRPRLQGLKLTAWELGKEGIPFRMIVDSAAAYLLQLRRVDYVITGADRITANGDTANKIGTYALAVAARHHGIPFYVAAPRSTFDPSLASGDLIEVEERDAREITEVDGHRIAPAECPVWNPAFDITPGELITAIIDEKGIYRAPYRFQSDTA
ncbi:MAG: S-methyl-5-thioribose-1-phosphate isomerase [Armatimonadetes bacterium]|nr:S-methyl-5-thioribose-1-phosphate isomerase [Armatimonadota bacterium]